MAGIIANQINANAAYTGDSKMNPKIALSFSSEKCFKSNWRNFC